MTRKILSVLFVLCTASAAQATDADQMLFFANDKVKDAVVHDVCDVRSPEMRDQLDAADRVAYGAIVATLQSALDHNGDRDTTTEAFCAWGRGLLKPQSHIEPRKPPARVEVPAWDRFSVAARKTVYAR